MPCVAAACWSAGAQCHAYLLLVVQRFAQCRNAHTMFVDDGDGGG